MSQDTINSAALLDRAVAVWNASRAARRDALLEVGRLLRQYLAQRVREDDCGPSTGRTRRSAALNARLRGVTEAARRLRIGTKRVNALIRAAVVADLLRPQGDLGSLPWAALRALEPCLHRQGADDWDIDPACLPWAAGLLAGAVAGSWTYLRLKAEVQRRRSSRPVGRPRGQRREPLVLLHLDDNDHGGLTGAQQDSEWLRVATLASPPDLCDLLLDLVERSRDPATVARLLLDRLPGVRGRRTEVLTLA